MTRFSLALPFLLSCTSALAAPWITPNDIHLRADLQRLADEGMLTIPVTSFPLMWSGIAENLQTNADKTLSQGGQAALSRVHERMAQEMKTGWRAFASVKAGTDTPRFQHFGSENREQAELQARAEYNSPHFAGNLAVTYADNAYGDDQELRFDGSYLAAMWGNWMLSAGYIEQWYGPSMNSALLMSTNARPIPGVYVSRNNSDAFETPWLSWIGPWTLTAGVSRMDDERHIDDTLLFTMRASVKPWPQLELGASRAAQLCGEDRHCNGETWKNMFTGEDNEVINGSNRSQPGNQMAAIDFRWGDTAFGVPYSIYAESMGEDSFGFDKFPPFQAKSWLYGASVSYSLFQHQVTSFVEYSDTSAWCNNRYNCTYEHSIYVTGMRYEGRAIGSTYDNDTRALTLGHIGFAPSGNQWKLNLRYLDLNHDDSNKNAPGGNTVAPVAETAYQLEWGYTLPLWRGHLALTGDFIQSEIEKTGDSNFDANIWANWTVQLL